MSTVESGERVRVHITPRPDGWAIGVRRGGTELWAGTQSEAFRLGRRLLERAGGGLLVVCNRRGAVRETFTIGAPVGTSAV